MWQRLGNTILKYRWIILAVVITLTALMALEATKVQLSYSFTNNIPQSNPVAKNFNKFKSLFGDDASNMVLGFQTDSFFSPKFIADFEKFETKLENIEGITGVLSIYNAFNIQAEETAGKKSLVTYPFFDPNSPDLARSENLVLNSEFYKGLLFNPEDNAYLMLLTLDSLHSNSSLRIELMQAVDDAAKDFGAKVGLSTHTSGLPFIRFQMAQMVQGEMGYFLLLSLIVTSLILIYLFRSVGIWICSLVYAGFGLIWGFGIMGILGFKITLLTALLGPLVVIISVPNIIYFINKYHSAYGEGYSKRESLHAMINKIGVVTLFTNLTTAIGFGVFSFTSSQVLREFGIVAGLTIVVLFILAIILLPIFLSLLPAPNRRQMKYMTNSWSKYVFDKIARLITFRRAWLYGVVIVTLIFTFWGISKLNTVSYIVDDLPRDSKLYHDLEFFNASFNGVMPFEIVVDTKKDKKATSFGTLKKLDNLSEYISGYDFISKPMSIAEGMKFARQAYYDGEPSGYGMPNNLDISFFAPYLQSDSQNSQMSSVTKNFVDENSRYARISYRMKDIGTVRMDSFLEVLKPEINSIFDSSKYSVFVTGTSVSFLEGSEYIIDSLQSSLFLAFLFIFASIFYLFRDWRILLIAIIVNVIPLLITAGAMGFLGIRVKPSTVLVFSVALGITVDMTIRFLTNLKQEQEAHPNKGLRVIILDTISEAGISIIFTTVILAFGFGVFVLSRFDGTRSLGILIPLTIVNAMISNLALLPSLLMWFRKTQMDPLKQD